jgi:hypothetical protein
MEWWKEVIDGNIRSKPPMRVCNFRYDTAMAGAIIP